jgi:hypothetical protein
MAPNILRLVPRLRESIAHIQTALDRAATLNKNLIAFAQDEPESLLEGLIACQAAFMEITGQAEAAVVAIDAALQQLER